MNCKPNDLAVVVRLAPDGQMAELLGHIFRLTERYPVQPDIPTWQYEGERLFVHHRGIKCRLLAIPDSMLQPLRDDPDLDEVTTVRNIDEGVTA